MADVIIAAVILAAVALAVRYIWKQKKNGAKCIGCPCSGGSSCHCSNENK